MKGAAMEPSRTAWHALPASGRGFYFGATSDPRTPLPQAGGDGGGYRASQRPPPMIAQLNGIITTSRNGARSRSAAYQRSKFGRDGRSTGSWNQVFA